MDAPDSGAGAGTRPIALFVTSNGTGLGHLTRSMAIARRLPDGLEPLMITLSQAAPVVRAQGFPVEYIASYGTPGAGSAWRWSRRLRGRLRAAIAEIRPSVLVFDGTHPYQGLVEALAGARGTHRVWCRRPMWRAGTGRAALARTRFFDAVLEPGELAESMDRGPTVERRAEAHRVAPIVFCRGQELLPRDRAARELGLEPDKVNVLVQLGQGPEVRAAVDRCLHHLAGREGVQVAALSSAIATLLDVPDNVVHLRSTYPMSRYYAAFDAAVVAAGYNAYHELARFGVPALHLPMARQTDDQAARARYAERAGIGLACDGPNAAGLEELLDRLLDPAGREAMSARLRQLRIGDGAAEAAEWIAELATIERPGGPARSRWRRWRQHPVRSAREAAPFVARLPVNLASVAWQSATAPRPPRTVVLALRAPGEQLEGGIAEVVAGASDPPERLLVISDSLDLAQLRAAGLGFEHVPGPGERQAELAAEAGSGTTGTWEQFARRRIELILAERPRPRRIVGVGEAGERLAAELSR